MKETLKFKVMNGMIWKLFEKIGMQAMQMIIQIILARLLLPEDYGIVGLLTIFINISDVFILQGFSTALIQKKNADELDYSSVFFANLLMSIVIYIIFYIISPYVAAFYNDIRLTVIMRVLCLNILFGAISAVHNAIISKKLEFKKSFVRGLSNIFTQGIVGIIMAIEGYGVWALVFSKLCGTLVGSLVLICTTKWKPSLIFSIDRVKRLFNYSSKVLGTNLLNTLFNNIHSLIIGRFFSKDSLGYYQRGQQIPQTIMSSIDGSMTEVLYPTFSMIQTNIVQLKKILRKSMRLSMYLCMPIMLGLLAVSRPLTIILLTEKWLDSVPFMELSCIICLFWPLAARNQALNAIGLSNITFKISVISKTLTIIFILLCVRFGIYAIMLGTILASFISLVITSYYVKKYINYTYVELIKDLLPTFLASLIMMIIVLGIGHINLNIYVQLLMQLICGVATYILVSMLLKIDSFYYLIFIIKSKKGMND